MEEQRCDWHVREGLVKTDVFVTRKASSITLIYQLIF